MKKIHVISILSVVILFSLPSSCSGSWQPTWDRKIDIPKAVLEGADFIAETYAISQLGSHSSGSIKASSLLSGLVNTGKAVNAVRLLWRYFKNNDHSKSYENNYGEYHDQQYLSLIDVYLAYREARRFVKANHLAEKKVNQEKLKKIKQRLFIRLVITTLCLIPEYCTTINDSENEDGFLSFIRSLSGFISYCFKWLYKRERQAYDLDLNGLIEETIQSTEQPVQQHTEE